ncbi:MAG TPA: choice-of-anchor G family protein [Brachybacterium faecium]|nr:choice-of-anchor G family protein [Brachybacterium faecium]
MERLQSPPPLTRRRRSPLLKGVIASFATASLTLLGLPAVHAAETDQSEALGRVINADVLGLDLADVGTSQSGNPSDAGPNSNPLNLGLIDDSVSLDLGTATLPLIGDENNVGLLHLGQAGALSSYAASEDPTSSVASAGAVGEGGALDLDGIENGTYGSASVDLTTLLAQVGVDGVSDEIVDELALGLGALGSTATADAGEVESEYVLADGTLAISSPAVGGLSTGLNEALAGVGDTLDAAVGENGLLGSVAREAELDLDVGVASVKAGGGTVAVTGVDDALAGASSSLLEEPLTDENGLVSIDLKSGVISVDLQQLGGEDGLNGLPANTELLDSATIERITGAVSEALGTVSERVGQVLIDDVINNVGVTVELPASVAVTLLTANVDIVVETTLGQLAGTAEGTPTIDIDGNLLGIIPVGTLLSGLTPVLETVLITPLQGVVNGLVDTATTGLTETVDGLVNPVLDTLSPVLSEVLTEVVSVTINEQPSPGYLGEESFTVNALSLQLLPNIAPVKVDLASSTVRAASEVADPVITATPERVQAGESTSVTGVDFPADSEVTVQLQDADGNDIGDPVTVTTDSNGEFTTPLPVPADAAEGDDYVIEAVAASGESATTPLAVIADDQADNTADNTSENTADNTTDNTSDNTTDNSSENTSDNTGDNAAENTGDNTSDNTGENTDVNTDVNTADNAADNTDVNTGDNTADNAAENTGENTDVNTDVNTAENTGENTADNTDVNTADNAADNTDVNTSENTADNTSDNTADNTATAEITLTPKRAVQGVDDVLVSGFGYTPSATAEAYLKPTNGEVLGPIGPQLVALAAAAVPGENIGTVDVDENGEVTFRVNSSELDLGDYIVTVIDNEDSTLADSDSFTVVSADSDDNTADNTAENTDVNTADNTAENTEVNSGDNTEVNTADNAAENTEVNTADNAADNTDVNTAENTGENTSDNTDANTGDNADDNAAEDPAIKVEPGSVEDGESTTVTGEGFPPNTEVEVQLVDPDGNPVGDPVTATTDDDGAFTDEITVPEGTEAGDYTVEAEAETGESATAELAVTNGDGNAGDDATTDPVVSVDPGTVAPGESTTVTGEDFPPNTEVEVQLEDADGNPVGDPVTATTDDEGAFTVDITVPEGTEAGDYTVQVEAETGESAAADLTVTGTDGSADNGADNAADNGADNAATNGADNTSDNGSATPGGNGSGSTGGGSTGAGNGGSTSGSGSGALAQTGAAGTAAMVGLAALLLVGGVAGVLVSRRSRS